MKNFLELIPKLASLFPKTIKGIVWAGMSLVHAYHLFTGSLFFNVSFKDAQGLEKLANVFFTPIQYLCEGKTVSYDPENKIYVLTQRFHYQKNKMIYSPLAFASVSSSVILGTTFKALSFLSSQTRSQYEQLRLQLKTQTPRCFSDYYRTIGIQIESFQKAQWIDPPKHYRKKGDENHLKEDKFALQAISDLLTEYEIPFWADCGTCLGAYRYGGIIPWDNDLDIAVIAEDFENVWIALQKLDPKKYIVQDWSNRGRPSTYIRIYIKSSRNHIDIYFNAIDLENRTLTNILSHEHSQFLPESWKIRERMYGKPVPFEVIFPLKKACFDDIVIPVPNQTALYLTYKYGPNISPTKIYNPKTQKYEKDLSHPYWQIPLSH